MILQTFHQEDSFQIVGLFLKDFLKKQAGFFFVLKAESAQGTEIVAILIVSELDIILINLDLREGDGEKVVGGFVEDVFFSIEDQLMEGFSGSSFLSKGQKGQSLIINVIGGLIVIVEHRSRDLGTLCGFLKSFPGFSGIPGALT